MAAIDDAKTVIGILAGSLPDNTRLIRIADAFVEYAGTRFNPVDPLNPTNEEKAQNFLNVLRWEGRRILGTVAADDKQAEQIAELQTAIDAAKGDL